MQTPTWRQLLLLLLLLTLSAGCQAFKRASWSPPLVASPEPPSGAPSATLAGAESAYAQAIELEDLEDATCVDCFFQAATLAWSELERQISAQGVAYGRAAELYRSSLTELIVAGQRYRRLDPKQGLQIRTAAGWVTVPTSHHGFPWQPADFDYLVPVGDYSTRGVNRFYRSAGLGVATVALHCRRQHEPFRHQQQGFPATALLRQEAHAASMTSHFVLELFDPLRISATTIAGRQLPLERDTTAPIVYVLSQADRDYITRFLQPGSTTANSGLFMIEPYQPGKIPVVFVHGLLSDPLTWANLANEIRAQPELLERYQIWAFEYATGEPFLQSAAVLRRQLREVQLRLDPTCSDAALSRMVLVGHSMGGLVSKLQITRSGTQLWESVSSRPFDNIVTTPATRMQLAESFFFQPSANVSRVVFIGTPHRGSPWAGRPIGRLGSRLVDEPVALQEEHRQLIRDNPQAFSREFTRRIPTSVDLLEPESPLLQAIDRLPHDRRVQLHSIVGSGFWLIGGGDSDKVVPVDSARKSGVVSEKLVEATHGNLHKHSAGVAELLCILKKHLTELDRDWRLE